MNGLRMIENGLVPIYETSIGESVVYGTELHGVIKPKGRYREWVGSRLDDVGAIKDDDYQTAEVPFPSGQTKKDHIIKLSTAKEIALLERNEKGKQVHRYFIQVEKKYKKFSQGINLGDKAFLETFEKFMETQTELSKMIAKKIAFIENQLSRKCIVGTEESMDEEFFDDCFEGISRIDRELSIIERKEHIYQLVEENARLREISINRVLHVIYMEIEQRYEVSLNAYKSVYRSETGNPEASMVEVISAHSRFYAFAVRIKNFMIEHFQK